MPVVAWIGIFLTLLVVGLIAFFVVRSLVTLVVARRELERPSAAAGVVEIEGPKRPRRSTSGRGRAREGPADEDRAMKEALERLESRVRGPQGVEAKRRPGEKKRPTES